VAATVLGDSRGPVTKPDVEILPSAYGTSFPLAWVAGYVDAVGFLTLAGLFVAHMSGNTVRLGVFVGDGDWNLAAQRFVPIVVFMLGVVGGIALVEALQRRSTPASARVLSIEALLLLVFMLVGRAVLDGRGTPAGSWDYYLLAALAVLAMGSQNVALRHVAGLPIHTTFVTGMLTYIGEELVHGWYARRDLRRAGTVSTRDDPARVAFRRARFHGGVWLSYLAGGVLGAFIALHWDLWSLTLPLAVLAVLIVLDPSDAAHERESTASRRVRVVGWDEVPVAGLADHLPAEVGLEVVVVRADPPCVVDAGLAVLLDRHDMVDLQKLVVGARLHSAGWVAGLEGAAQLHRDRALR
jgi:uncharacterized membrane protein YoaK (UPF0700 family)